MLKKIKVYTSRKASDVHGHMYSNKPTRTSVGSFGEVVKQPQGMKAS